jgi:alkylation response protein AidB-like acyl-CoA dehydrogenase
MRRADTPEEAAFRAEARRFLEASAEPRRDSGNWSDGPHPHTPENERRHFERCRAWQRTLFDGGFAGIAWPKKYGGRGGTPIQAMIFAEEQARFDVTAGFLPASIALLAPALLKHGSETQRERYLKPLLRGDETWCQLFSEPGAGSDLAALRTRAEPRGDHFVVNGQKLWTSSAQFCDRGFLLARTNPDKPKHAGISFLLVDMRQPGVEVRPLVTAVGGRHFNEVFFSDFRVPVENVVGGIDSGWEVAKTTLANESVMIGSGRGKLGSVAALAREARARGRFGDPLVRQQLGRALVEERVLAMLQDRLQEAVLEGRRPDVDGSVLKVLWSESRFRKAEIALSLQDAAGLLEGDDALQRGFWQEQWLDRPMGSVGGGTLEVHRNGIGERVLGLPREPREDRDRPFRELEA